MKSSYSKGRDFNHGTRHAPALDDTTIGAERTFLWLRVIIHKVPTVRAAVRCAVCFGLRRKPVETFFANTLTSQPWMEKMMADI